jgi:hypothetical protein
MPNDNSNDGGKLYFRQPTEEEYTDPKNEKRNQVGHIILN